MSDWRATFAARHHRVRLEQPPPPPPAFGSPEWNRQFSATVHAFSATVHAATQALAATQERMRVAHERAARQRPVQ